jgi:heme-degrading monooxygenase HmoA
VSITRINLFTAKPGAEQQLYEFLRSVIGVIQGSGGCISCTLLRGAEDSSQLAIIEEWQSITDHQAAASAIPPEQLAQAMQLFAKPPTGAYYHP